MPWFRLVLPQKKLYLGVVEVEVEVEAAAVRLLAVEVVLSVQEEVVVIVWH
jgi:hypothetical protein